MAEEADTQYKYNIKDLDVISVTVYKDRPQVKRSAKVTAEKGGAIEIVVHGLSTNCDLDSIRYRNSVSTP